MMRPGRRSLAYVLAALVAASALLAAPGGDRPAQAQGARSTERSRPAATAAATTTLFQQPLVPGIAADPTITHHDGNYYLLYNKAHHNNAIVIRKATSLAGLRYAPDQIIYTGTTPGHPADLQCGLGQGGWLVPSGGRWYLYGWGDDCTGPEPGTGDFHSRPFVLESAGSDPLGPYSFKALIEAPSGVPWGYAAAPVTIGGRRYITWVYRNRMYIAALSDPWTVSSPWSLLTEATTATGWECAGGRCIDEGASVVERGGKVFLVFSAGGYESPNYCVGMLTADVTANPLSPSSWTKSGDCVFERNDAARAYGPASMNLFTSPDGTETWAAYHIKTTTASTGGDRMLQARKVTWNPDGTPNFGSPYENDVYVQAPSGDPGLDTVEAEAGAIVGGTVASSSYASSQRYVGGLSAGGSVTVDVASLVTVPLRAALYYANPGSAAAVSLSVNGGPATTVRLPGTGSTSSGRFGVDRYVPVDLPLRAGGNTVRIEGATGTVQLDKLQVDYWTVGDGPAVAARSQSNLDLYAANPAGQVWSRAWEAATGWGGWFQPGTASPPSGARNHPGAASRKPLWLDVVALGRNGTVYTKWWQGVSPEGWRDWYSIGAPGPGVAAGGAAIAGRTANHLDVFVLGADGDVWRRPWHDPAAGGGGWGAWSTLGAPAVGLTSPPAVVSHDGSVLDVYATGSDGLVWVTRWDGTTWSDWSPLASPPGGATSAPAVASEGTFNMELFVRGREGQLWNREWSLTYFGWGPWAQVPGPSALTESAPAAVSRRTPSSSVDLVVRRAGQLQATAWTGTSWQPWTSLGAPP